MPIGGALFKRGQESSGTWPSASDYMTPGELLIPGTTDAVLLKLYGGTEP